MKISKNDPRLTAYVLNELDELEKSMIEHALRADPELQSEVAQIKRTIGVFNTLAKPQDEMALSNTQRDKIFEKPASSPGWSWWTMGGSLATACLALVLFQQKAHEKTELMVSVPVSQSVPTAPKKSALAKNPVVKVEQQAPAEMNVAADSLEEDKLTAFNEAKRAESQEFEKSTNNVSAGGLGASAGLSAASDYGSVSKSPSATAVAKPIVAARMAKDQPSASAAPEQARGRLQEMPRELDVSLSQFLPTETEPADVEISMNLTRELKKCFSENFSKYVRYNLKINLNWSMQKSRPVKIQITDPLGAGVITDEIRGCVKQSFESQNWSDVRYIRETSKPLQFEAVVTIVSE